MRVANTTGVFTHTPTKAAYQNGKDANDNSEGPKRSITLRSKGEAPPCFSGETSQQRRLGQRLDFTEPLHALTKRDYVARVADGDKAHCAEVASLYGADYWDGERCFGYGGYLYDGRWRPVAQRIADHYALRSGMSVLDIGCGKGYLLYELAQVVVGLEVVGVDISAYAIANAKAEVQPCVSVADAAELTFADGRFDLAISLGTFHNLSIDRLWSAVEQIERVAQAKYIVMEAYQNDREKVNLLNWQLTCRSFYSVGDWEWIFRKIGYSGDYGFIFFD